VLLLPRSLTDRGSAYSHETEVKDRIFSTSVEYNYTINLPTDVEVTIENLDKIQSAVDFDKVSQLPSAP
jgi:hypothetical protein